MRKSNLLLLLCFVACLFQFTYVQSPADEKAIESEGVKAMGEPEKSTIEKPKAHISGIVLMDTISQSIKS
jgi:hypothetical protein